MVAIKEVRNHIKSVQETLKITNAMYLIASAGLRKAKKQLDDTLPYFNKISSTISDILYYSPEINHLYFDLRPEKGPEERQIGYIVMTGDKGLCGAYNHNVLKLAEEHLANVTNPTLFIVGQAGRVWFAHRNIRVDGEFMYTAQNPTVARAREICDACLPLFQNGSLDEIFLIYTRMVNAMTMEPVAVKLLPLERNLFPRDQAPVQRLSETVKYVPSEKAVMDRLVPSYLSGMIFGALVESFCSEQNARMTAMNASSKNARKMLKNLNLTYNRVRQAAITQEITEVVGGSQTSNG